MRRFALLCLALLWGLAALAQDTPDTALAEAIEDKGRLTRFIENQLSDVSREVTITGFEGALSTRATIARLAVSDRDGEWLVMEDLSLDWDRSALLTGQLIVQELTATRISMPRRPLPDPRPPSATATPLGWPDLPLSITIGTLNAPRVELGEDWLGQETVLSLEGQGFLAGRSASVQFSALRRDGLLGRFEVSASYDDSTGQADVDISAVEGPKGLAVTLLSIPDKPAGTLTIKGAGPITDLTTQIRLTTDGQDRISGAVGLHGEGDERRVSVDVQGDVAPLFAPAYRDFFGPDVGLQARGVRGADGALRLDTLRLTTAAFELTGRVGLRPNGWPLYANLRARVHGAGNAPVLLPLPGERTTVKWAEAQLYYDPAQSPIWVGGVELLALDRSGLTVSDAFLDAQGEITPQTEDSQGRWTLTGTYGGYGLAFAELGLALAAGPDIEGRLAASGGAGRPALIEELTLTSTGATAYATGSVMGRGGGFQTQLALDVQAQDLAPFQALAGLQTTGAAEVKVDFTTLPFEGDTELHVSGSSQDLAIGNAAVDALLAGDAALDLHLLRDVTGTRVPAFAITSDHAQITGTADVTPKDLSVALRAEIPDSAVLPGTLSGPSTLVVDALRVGAGDTRLQAKADLPQAQATLSGIMRPRDEDYVTDATLAMSVADLAPYAQLLGRPVTGRAEIEIDGSYAPLTGGFTLLSRADTQGLALGQPQLDALLAGAGHLRLSANRSDPQSLSVERFALKTDLMQAQGSGQIAQGGATADFAAQIRDASALDPALSGPVQLTGRAVQPDTGGTQVTLDATAPDARVELSADLASPPQSAPAVVSAHATLSDLTRYRGLLGQQIGGAADLTAKGRYHLGTDAFAAELTGTTQDLDIGQPRLRAALAGPGQLAVTLRRDKAGRYQLSDLDLRTAGAQITGTGQLAAAQTEGTLRAHLPDARVIDPALSGPATLDLVAAPKAGGTTALTLSAKAQGAQMRASATVMGADRAYETQFDATGTIPSLAAWQRLIGLPVSGRVDLTASGRALPRQGRLSTEAELTSQGLGLGIPALDALVAGPGTTRTTLHRRGDGTLVIDTLTAHYANLRATASGAPDGVMRYDVTIPNGAALSPLLPGALTAQGSVQSGPLGQRIRSTLSGPAGLRAQVAGQVRPGGTLDLHLTGAAPLALLNPQIAPRSLSGTADFDLLAQGPARPEALRGTVQIRGGAVSLPQLHSGLREISGPVQINQGRAELDLKGQVAAGGQISLRGPVTLNAGLDSALRLTGTGITQAEPGVYTSSADLDVTVTGPLRRGAQIAGRVDLGRTEITVPDRSFGGFGTLPDIQHRGAPTQVRRSLDRAGLSTAGIDKRRGGNSATGAGARDEPEFPIDLTISAPARVFVRGRGLDAELGGEIHLGGRLGRLIPAGRLSLIRGRMDLLQQRLRLTEGYATFEGDLSPYLHLEAETTQDDMTVWAVMEGDASDPQLSFSSLPDLPEDEILSQLIFGQRLRGLSPLQAVQLAASVNTLRGGKGLGLVTALREGGGLDDLDLTTDADGEINLRAGKYLTEDLYTDVQLGSDGTGRVSVDLNISDSVNLRASTGSDGESSVGIFFEKDY